MDMIVSSGTRLKWIKGEICGRKIEKKGIGTYISVQDFVDQRGAASGDLLELTTASVALLFARQKMEQMSDDSCFKIFQSSKNCFAILTAQIIVRFWADYYASTAWKAVNIRDSVLRTQKDYFFCVCCEHEITYKFSFIIVKFVYYCKGRIGSITFSILLPLNMRFIIHYEIILYELCSN